MSNLDPSTFLDNLSCCFKSDDELESRRCVSILFYCVFNLWMEKVNLAPGFEVHPGNMIDSVREYNSRTGITDLPIADLKELEKYRTISDHFFGNNITFLLRSTRFSQKATLDLKLQKEMKTYAIRSINFLKNLSPGDLKYVDPDS